MIVYINYTVSMNKDTEANIHRQSHNVRIWVSNRAAYNNNNNNNNNNQTYYWEVRKLKYIQFQFDWNRHGSNKI